jgi:hypothetical protein
VERGKQKLQLVSTKKWNMVTQTLDINKMSMQKRLVNLRMILFPTVKREPGNKEADNEDKKLKKD